MLKQGEQYSAEDFIALKNKVKAEMLRRCHTGSLEAYGGEEYDFSTIPEKGLQILAEQANKIIEPINAIDNSGFTVRNIGDPAMAMNGLDAKITAYSVIPEDSAEPGCKESCSGLCYTVCSSECTGECAGECGETCTTSCTGKCTGSCTGTCSTSCFGGCISGCSWDCTNGCGNSCTSLCADNCVSDCGNTSL